MEDFVPYELAVKLKEKGFREKCFARYYYSDKAYFERNSYDPDTNSILYCYNDDKDLGRFYIDAPTISQVLKWLRKKNIHLYTDVDNEGWFFEIKCLKTRFMINTDFFKRYNTYELAALAGIEYIIDNNLI